MQEFNEFFKTVPNSVRLAAGRPEVLRDLEAGWNNYKKPASFDESIQNGLFTHPTEVGTTHMSLHPDMSPHLTFNTHDF